LDFIEPLLFVPLVDDFLCFVDLEVLFLVSKDIALLVFAAVC